MSTSKINRRFCLHLGVHVYRLLCSSICDTMHLYFNKLSLRPGDINAIGFVIAQVQSLKKRSFFLIVIAFVMKAFRLFLTGSAFLKSS